MKKTISIVLTVSLLFAMFASFTPVTWDFLSIKALAETNETVSIIPEADAGVQSWKDEKQRNYGSKGVMNMIYNEKLDTSDYNTWNYHPDDLQYDFTSDGTDLKVGYMRFDTSNIDKARGIKKVELRVSSTSDLSSKKLRVYGVDDTAWNEGKKDGNTSNSSVINDGSNGINFYCRPKLSSELVVGNGGTANNFSALDVSDYAREKISDNKISLAVVSDSANGSAKFDINSKENTNEALRPNLLITYYTPDEIANGLADSSKNSEQIKLEMDYTALSVPAIKDQDNTNLILPTLGTNSGTKITWKSSDPSIIGDGSNGLALGEVTQNQITEGIKDVTLTASISGCKKSRKFVVSVGKNIQRIVKGIKSVESLKKDTTSLVMPTVPEGYAIAVKSAVPSGIIGTDGEITLPDISTLVSVVFTVTDNSNGTTVDTPSINVMVPGKTLTWDSTKVPNDIWSFMGPEKFNGTSTFINGNNMIGSVSDLTVAFKMTADKIANMIPISKSPSSGNVGWSVRLNDTGDISFRIGSNSAYKDVTTPRVYSDGKQINVAFTFDSANNTAKIYVNGNLAVVKTGITANTVNDTISNLRVGIPSENSYEKYLGVLSNVHIYDKVLNEYQINMLNSEPVKTVSNPVINYEGSASAPDHKLSLWYRKPATDWSKEALPIGNGYMGGMVFGDVLNDRIQYNDKTLWTGGPVDGDTTNYKDGNRDGAANHLASVREKLFNGDKVGAEAEMDESMTGETVNYGSYQSFGDIFLKSVFPTDNPLTVMNYRRELDLEDGIVRVFYTVDGVNYKREYFCSYPDNVMVIRLTADQPGKLNLGITPTSAELVNATVEGDDILVTRGTLSDNKLIFESRMKVINDGGTRTAETNSMYNGQINVSNANSLTIVMTTGTNYANKYPSYRGIDPHDNIVARINSASSKSYDVLKTTHINDYQKLFNRVKLDLGNSASTIPTDELRLGYATSGDKSLEVLMYQMGRYMLIASSRPGSIPANLQGVWNDSNTVAWQSDYHFNVNIQMNYWPVEVANLSECAIPLIEYTKDLVEPGRITAAKHFGVTNGGWVVNTMNNPFGFTAPGFKSSWGWAPNSNAFIGNNLWEHYQFTGDKEYLRSTIYPIIKEAAEFWAKWLIEDKDGKLVSAPSYSPEHGPNDPSGPSISVGDAMDQQFAYDLFTNVIDASNILGIDEDFRNELIDKRSKLSDPVKIGKWGQVQEWKDDLDDKSNTHRHLSELMALYPGKLININTPEWLEAAKVKMRHRSGLGDDGVWTSSAVAALDQLPGWSKANKLNLWARAHDGDSAYAILQSQLRSTTYSNLFDYHIYPEVFQIDGNLGYVSGVSELILQSQAGNIELLPALPSQWAQGSVNGVVARGNFEVGMKWSNRKIDEVTIKSNKGNKCILKNSVFENNKGLKVVKMSDSSLVDYTSDGDTISFDTKEGESYTINFQK